MSSDERAKRIEEAARALADSAIVLEDAYGCLFPLMAMLCDDETSRCRMATARKIHDHTKGAGLNTILAVRSLRAALALEPAPPRGRDAARDEARAEATYYQDMFTAAALSRDAAREEVRVLREALENLLRNTGSDAWLTGDSPYFKAAEDALARKGNNDT